VSVIVGVNAYHGDSAACIVVDGQLRAAVEEERFRRIKHWAGFPSEAIRYCLREVGVRLADVDVLAINSDPKAGRGDRARYLLQQRPSPGYVVRQLRTRAMRASIGEVVAREFPYDTFKGRVRHVEHHLAHLASAYYVSPYDDAAVVSVDGFGDFASAAWGRGQGGRIDILKRVPFPHSLGVLYETLTQYLGFPHYGDEYKVMGLAPYGEPRFVDALKDLVHLKDDGGFELNLRYFRHAKERVVSAWDGQAPEKLGLMYTPALEELLGPARKQGEPLGQAHKDLARSVQVTYENAFFHLLAAAHRAHPSDALALAGGCAANSVANGKITLRSPFKRVYVQSAAGDAGGAVGAALYAHHEQVPEAKHAYVKHAYLGPSFGPAHIARVVAEHAAAIAAEGCVVQHYTDVDALCTDTAQAVADGRVVGWFQGRMEWGPRALGNRSILGDPRRADMKDILNLKIKRRESFRPFAPSVLREHVAEWFELDDEVPFMMKVFQIRKERRPEIPAVTHVDGSGRLQTVYADTNPRYHALISAFFARTGVPMVLNTSFNENEPVVCQPEEALDCFLRTKMDVLVLGDTLIARRS
jgi:carbamoyltransferase